MTRTTTRVQTYTAIETLPDGRTRVLVTGLTFAEMLAHRFGAQTWAVSWAQDAAAPSLADRSHAVIAMWAANAEAAQIWTRYDELMRHGETDAPKTEELWSALLHWAERDDRYEEPHRSAATEVWALYTLMLPSAGMESLAPTAWSA